MQNLHWRNIQDTIPDGQSSASEITGYYFPDWEMVTEEQIG